MVKALISQALFFDEGSRRRGVTAAENSSYPCKLGGHLGRPFSFALATPGALRSRAIS